MKKKFTLLLLSVLLLASCAKKSYPVSAYRREMKYHDDFTIMQFTDIHIGSESDIEDVLSLLNDEINYETTNYHKPDLIVMTGDNFTNASKAIINRAISYYDSWNIPFALTYGNHDFQGSYDRFYIADQLRKTENAVFVDYDYDDIYGQANYYINLKSNIETEYRVYIIDSNSYMQRGIKMNYDIIHEDQLQHIDDICKEEGKVPGLAFYHIPVYEFKDAYNLYLEGKIEGKGENHEGVSYGYKRNDAFKRMKDDGVIGMFVGHDHINDTSLLYQDVLLSYGVKSTGEIYHEKIGYTRIKLHGQDKLSLDDVDKVIYKDAE